MSVRPSVFIVDEDVVVLKHCECLLNEVGFACQLFSSGVSFLQSEWRLQANCVVLDVTIEVEERFDNSDGSSGDFPFFQRTQRGFGGLAKILRGDGTMPVIVMSGDFDGPLVRDVFLAGAYDMLAKPLNESLFRHSVSTAVARKNRQRMQDSSRPVDVEIRGHVDNLTPREFEVLGEMLRGMSIKQLAARFEISIQTAAKHRARVLHKMRAENEVHLIHLLGRRWQQVYLDIVI